MKKISEKRKARVLALEALYQYEFRPDEANVIGRFKWVDKKLSDFVFGFAKKIFLGTIENLEKIDGLVEKFSKNWDMDRMSKVDKNILRLSLYQLMFFEKANPKIIIDEAVEISKSFSTPKSYRFINGVLDVICKELGFYKVNVQKKTQTSSENNTEIVK